MFDLKRNRIADIALLAVFCALTLLVGFFHTEKTIENSQACPACQFQSSSIATQVTQSFFVPQIALLEMVPAFRIGLYEHVEAVDRSPRGPPEA